MAGLLKKRYMKKGYYNYFFLLFLLTFVYSGSMSQEEVPENNPDTVPPVKSSIEIGVSFASQALSSGRDFGVSQYSMMPSFMYYHKSGFHTGIVGNILSNADPKYNLTTATIGYGDTINDKWDYDISYTRNFFNPDTAGLIQNSIGGSINFLSKYFNISAQYAYLFGNEKAHRVITGANAYLSKDCRKHINNINFTPGVLITFGTANIPFNTFTSTQFKSGTGLPWQQWKTQRLNRRLGTSTTAQNLQFGLMNIDWTVPVTVSIKKFQIGLSYTYAIPQKLKEETSAEISATGYFGASLIYSIK